MFFLIVAYASMLNEHCMSLHRNLCCSLTCFFCFCLSYRTKKKRAFGGAIKEQNTCVYDNCKTGSVDHVDGRRSCNVKP